MAGRSARDVSVSRLVTPRVVTVEASDDAALALRLLVSDPTPGVIVCREGTPVGIVTLRDLGVVCAVHWPNLSASRLRAEQIMSSPLIVVRPDATLAELAPLLMRADLECMAVVRDGKLMGVLERNRVLRTCLRMLTR